jgi:hypothetical protein
LRSLLDHTDSQPPNSNIKFVAAARLGGANGSSPDDAGSIVASYSAEPRTQEFEQVVADVLATPEFSNRVTTGTPYRLGAAINAFNFIIDGDGIMYSTITLVDYPEALSLALVTDLAKQFKQQFGKRPISCAPGELTSEATHLMKGLADR